MTGPEHFQKAEKLVQLAEVENDTATIETLVGCAQVHATLAQVAATVWSNLPYMLKTAPMADQWREVIA